MSTSVCSIKLYKTKTKTLINTIADFTSKKVYSFVKLLISKHLKNQHK